MKKKYCTSSIDDFGNFNYNSCNRCGSENIRTGAGLKPGQESRKCGDCGQFLGYSPVERLKRLRKRKNFTESLELLESHGILSQEGQIFVLSEVGGMGGEA